MKILLFSCKFLLVVVLIFSILWIASIPVAGDFSEFKSLFSTTTRFLPNHY